MPSGPEVIVCKANEIETTEAIKGILDEWLRHKFCKIDDIAILGIRRELDEASIGALPSITGYPLADYRLDDPRYELRYLGIHRAKGLDFLGVIIIDLYPLNGTVEDRYFPAAT